MDAFYNDHSVVLGLDFASDLTGQLSFASGDLTRFQRASEGACQSAAGGCDDVVERRCALGLGSRRYAVVFCDVGVHAEHDLFRLGRDLCGTKRPTDSLDPDL